MNRLLSGTAHLVTFHGENGAVLPSRDAISPPRRSPPGSRSDKDTVPAPSEEGLRRPLPHAFDGKGRYDKRRYGGEDCAPRVKESARNR